MKCTRLLVFECKRQICSFTFLIVLAVFTVFMFSQLIEIIHIPVKTEQDIQALNQCGERDYIMIDDTEQNFIANTVMFLRQRIEDGSIPQNKASDYDEVFSMFESGSSFNEVFEAMQHNEDVYSWLRSCKEQYQQRMGSVEEVNADMASAMGNRGYSPVLCEKYVSYMQVIVSFLMFPLYLMMLTRDYRHGMYEVIYEQPIHPDRYILLRYFGVLAPLVIYLYVFGLLLNLISAGRFVMLGYEYQYTAFFPYFITYLFPTVFFFSVLVMLLMLLTRRAVAAFPICVLIYLLTATPGIFGLDKDWFRKLSPVLRLDMWSGSQESIWLNRMVYLGIGILCIAVACAVYNRLRTNLRKGVRI